MNLLKYLILFSIFVVPIFLGKFYTYPVIAFFIFNSFLLLIYLLLMKGSYIKIYYNYSYLIFALFTMIAAFSFTYSFSYFSTRDELIKLGSYLLLSFLMINIFQKDDIIKIFYTIVLSGLVIAVYGLCIYLLAGIPDYLIFSTFFNPNELAGFLIICIMINILLFLNEENKLMKLRLFSIFVIITICMLLTGSRGALLSLIIALSILFLLSNKQLRVRLIPLFLSLFLLFIILFSTKPIIREKITTFFDTSHRSHLFRVLIAKGALNIIKEKPLLGFGLGSFQFVYPYYKLGGVNTQMAHNTYLQQVCELGFIGFFVFISFIISILLTQFRRVKITDNNLIPLILFCAALTFIIHNLFDYTYYIAATSIYFFIIIACFNLFTNNIKECKIKKYFILPPFMILFFICTFFIAKVGLANFYAASGEELFEFDKKLEEAIRKYNRATLLDKLNSEYYYELAFIYREKKEFTLAKQKLMKALTLQQNNAFYHYQLGVVYYNLGNIRLAKQQFEYASSLHKRYTPALIYLAEIYLQKGDKEKAIYYFQKVVDIGTSPYESEKYEPIKGRKINPDFEYARRMVERLQLELEVIKDKNH